MKYLFSLLVFGFTLSSAALGDDMSAPLTKVGPNTYNYEFSVFTGLGVSAARFWERESEESGRKSYESIGARQAKAAVQARVMPTPIGNALAGLSFSAISADETIGAFRREDGTITSQAVFLSPEVGFAQMIDGTELQETIAYDYGMANQVKMQGEAEGDKVASWQTYQVNSADRLTLNIRGIKEVVNNIQVGVEVSTFVGRLAFKEKTVQDELAGMSTSALVGYRF